MWAAEQSHAAAAKLLIANGAEVNTASAPEIRPRGAYLAPSAVARFANGDAVERRRPVAPPRAVTSGDDVADAAAFFGNRNQVKDGGGITPLVFAAREGDLETVKVLVDAGAKVNQTTNYGWTALLTATQNKNYKIGKYPPRSRSSTPTSPTTAAGVPSTSPPTTATSKVATIPSAPPTWITSNTSSSCSIKAPT